MAPLYSSRCHRWGFPILGKLIRNAARGVDEFLGDSFTLEQKQWATAFVLDLYSSANIGDEFRELPSYDMLPGPDSLGLHNMMGVLVRLHISTIDNDNEGTSASPQRMPKEELQSTKQSEAVDAQERLTNDSKAKGKTAEHQTLTQQLTASPLKQLRPDAAHFQPAQVTPEEVVSDPFAIQNSCDCCGHAGHRAHPYPTPQAPPMYDSGRFYSPGNSMAYVVCPDGRHMAISALTPVRVPRPEDARKNVRESMQHLITMPKPSFMWTHPLLEDFYAQQFGNIPRRYVIENGVELPTMPQGGWLPNLHNSTYGVSPVYDSYQKTVTKPEITQKSLTDVATSNSVQNTSKKTSSSSSHKPHASNNLLPPEKSVQVSKKPSRITGVAKTSKGDKFATALESAMKAVGVVLERKPARSIELVKSGTIGHPQAQIFQKIHHHHPYDFEVSQCYYLSPYLYLHLRKQLSVLHQQWQIRENLPSNLMMNMQENVRELSRRLLYSGLLPQKLLP